jgi:hypothetical protein
VSDFLIETEFQFLVGSLFFITARRATHAKKIRLKRTSITPILDITSSEKPFSGGNTPPQNRYIRACEKAYRHIIARPRNRCGNPDPAGEAACLL